MKIKIYSGLSLSKEDVQKHLPTADFSPPVCRNNLLEDLKKNYQVIGIIDGEFLQSMAVSPTEIMDVMRCGVKIYGSSSMGALRAVELEPFGMIGVGRVFEHIKAQEHFEDDHLGQLFFEGSSHISLPYIDFYTTIEDLVAKKRAGSKEAQQLLKAYKSLHFSERSFGALKAVFSKKSSRSSSKILQLIDYISRIEKHVKHFDGIKLLNLIKNDRLHCEKINNRLHKLL